ncbi:MAG: hypothetical protein EZS28_037354 [Streblomastix strix]|uniref:Uncharacterized protein n=1 Tax=Streblomastix strix TaxID=222440 RepID=A0A5J4U9S1_9EUKA|nr:MAG: hypothetical protein EZS28_037354 [Streblomastix strix]
MEEICWWKARMEEKRPIRASIQISIVILTTDASQKNSVPEGLIQEVEAIQQQPTRDSGLLCGLTSSEPFLKSRQVKTLKIETDNSATSYNLNSGAAAASLRKLTDHILKIVEDTSIQIHPFHIKVKTNTIPDSHSRQTIFGDYSLKEKILKKISMILGLKPTVVMFAKRRNKYFQRFASLIKDNQAIAQDHLSIPWCQELPYLHPPIRHHAGRK